MDYPLVMMYSFNENTAVIFSNIGNLVNNIAALAAKNIPDEKYCYLPDESVITVDLDFFDKIINYLSDFIVKEDNHKRLVILLYAGHVTKSVISYGLHRRRNSFALASFAPIAGLGLHKALETKKFLDLLFYIDRYTPAYLKLAFPEENFGQDKESTTSKAISLLKKVNNEHAMKFILGSEVREDEFLVTTFKNINEVLQYAVDNKINFARILDFVYSENIDSELSIELISGNRVRDIYQKSLHTIRKTFIEVVRTVAPKPDPFIMFYASGLYTFYFIMRMLWQYISKLNSVPALNKDEVQINELTNFYHAIFDDKTSLAYGSYTIKDLVLGIRNMLSSSEEDKNIRTWYIEYELLRVLCHIIKDKVHEEYTYNFLEEINLSLIAIRDNFKKTLGHRRNQHSDNFLDMLSLTIRFIDNCVRKKDVSSFLRDLRERYEQQHSKTGIKGEINNIISFCNENPHAAFPWFLWVTFNYFHRKNVRNQISGFLAEVPSRRSRRNSETETGDVLGSIVIENSRTNVIVNALKRTSYAKRPVLDLIVLMYSATNAEELLKAGIINKNVYSVLRWLSSVISRPDVATALRASRIMAAYSGFYNMVKSLYEHLDNPKKLLIKSLRDHQKGAVLNLIEVYDKMLEVSHEFSYDAASSDESEDKRTGFILSHAPGTGKSVVISYAVANLLEKYPDKRVLLVSKDEILRKIEYELNTLSDYTSRIKHIFSLAVFEDYFRNMESYTKEYSVVAVNFSILSHFFHIKIPRRKSKSNDSARPEFIAGNDEENWSSIPKQIEEADIQADEDHESDEDSYKVRLKDPYEKLLMIEKFLRFIYSFDIIVVDESHHIKNIYVDINPNTLPSVISEFSYEDYKIVEYNERTAGASSYHNVDISLLGYRIGASASTLAFLFFISKIAKNKYVYVEKDPNDTDSIKYGKRYILSKEVDVDSLELLYKVPNKDLFYVLSSGTIVANWMHDLWMPLFLINVPETRLNYKPKSDSDLLIRSPYEMAYRYLAGKINGMVITYGEPIKTLIETVELIEQSGTSLENINLDKILDYLEDSDEGARIKNGLLLLKNIIINREKALRSIDIFSETSAIESGILREVPRNIRTFLVDAYIKRIIRQVSDFSDLMSQSHSFAKMDLVKNEINRTRILLKERREGSQAINLNSGDMVAAGHSFHHVLLKYSDIDPSESSPNGILIRIVEYFINACINMYKMGYKSGDVQFYFKYDGRKTPVSSIRTENTGGMEPSYRTNINEIKSGNLSQQKVGAVNDYINTLINKRISEVARIAGEQNEIASMIRSAVDLVRLWLHGMDVVMSYKDLREVRKEIIATEVWMSNRKINDENLDGITMREYIVDLISHGDNFYQAPVAYYVKLASALKNAANELNRMTVKVELGVMHQMILKISSLVGYIIVDVLRIWLEIDAGFRKGTGKIFIVAEHEKVAKILYYAFAEFMSNLTGRRRIKILSSVENIRLMIEDITKRVMRLAYGYYYIDNMKKMGISGPEFLTLAGDILEEFNNAVDDYIQRTMPARGHTSIVLTDTIRAQEVKKFLSRVIVLGRAAVAAMMLNDLELGDTSEYESVMEDIFVNTLNRENKNIGYVYENKIRYYIGGRKIKNVAESTPKEKDIFDYLVRIGAISAHDRISIEKTIEEKASELFGSIRGTSATDQDPKIYSSSGRILREIGFLLRERESLSGKNKTILSSEFLYNPELKVIIGGMHGVSEGLDYERASAMYIVEPTYSVGVMNQVESRVNRFTTEDPTEVNYIVADTQADTRIIHNIATKDILISALMEMGKNMGENFLKIQEWNSFAAQIQSRLQSLLKLNKDAAAGLELRYNFQYDIQNPFVELKEDPNDNYFVKVDSLMLELRTEDDI